MVALISDIPVNLLVLDTIQIHVRTYAHAHTHDIVNTHIHKRTYSDTGSLVSLLELNYIYILGFLCVAVLCILPLVAFPVIVSIVDTPCIRLAYLPYYIENLVGN